MATRRTVQSPFQSEAQEVELIREMGTDTIGKLGGGLGQGLANGIAEAFGNRGPAMVRILGKALSGQQLRHQLLPVNKALALGAQEAVLEGYLHRTPRRTNPSYRQGQGRFSGGQLERALASPAMIEGTTAFVISFLDKGHLSATAPQWRQVNFGAAGAGGGPGSKEPGTYEMLLNGRGVGSLHLKSRPRVPINMPVGYWTNAGGKGVNDPGSRNGEFHVHAGKGLSGKFAGGSRATQFVDAGMQFLAKETGPAYYAVLLEVISSARGKARIEKGTGVKIPVNLNRSPAVFGAGS